jgi:hypothetical protein
MTVRISPMPTWVRQTRYRPRPAPVFLGDADEASRDDIELALALFEELDPESQGWYGGEKFVHRLREQLARSF